MAEANGISLVNARAVGIAAVKALGALRERVVKGHEKILH
jgi:hypothetical protein